LRNYKNRIIVFKVAQYFSHLISRAGEILTGVKFNYHNAGKYAIPRVCEREMERNTLLRT